MEEVSIIGIDLAKRSFQLHGAKADGSVAYRTKLSRARLWAFSPRIRSVRWRWRRAPAPTTGPADRGGPRGEAAPRYVKPFVTLQKNDAADAEITEAAQRPTMHSGGQDRGAAGAGDALSHARPPGRQRTTINALRGHLAEYGVVAPQGRAWIAQLAGVLEDEA